MTAELSSDANELWVQFLQIECVVDSGHDELILFIEDLIYQFTLNQKSKINVNIAKIIKKY